MAYRNQYKPFNRSNIKCRFGLKCTRYKNGNCAYLHTEEVPVSKTQQIRSTIKCRLGEKCERHKHGKCDFWHPEQVEKTKQIRATIACKYGLKCEHYKQGNCEFLHIEKKNITTPMEVCSDDEQKQETVNGHKNGTTKTQKIRSTIKCKFGSHCKHFKQGICEFAHDNDKLFQNKLKLQLFEAEQEKQRIKLKYEVERKLLQKEKHKMLSEKLKIESEKKEIAKKLEQESKEKQNILKDIQKQVFKWQWEDDKYIWNEYNDIINTTIEKLKLNETYTFTLNTFEIIGNKYKYTIKRISTDSAEQINLETNKKRCVRRITELSNMHKNDITYPIWWNMYKITKYSEPILISLDLQNDPIAMQVMCDFAQTSNRQIIKIESIQNQMLFDKYCNEKQTLLKLKDGNQCKLNEHKLFHGTKREDVMRIVQKEGFRKEFTQTAVYGEGTYFARQASYSVNYSSYNNGICKMFQCLVLCGESTNGHGAYKLKTWPKKISDGLIFDSLVDNIFNPSIYVIHSDVRAYPMFIIHFR